MAEQRKIGTIVDLNSKDSKVDKFIDQQSLVRAAFTHGGGTEKNKLEKPFLEAYPASWKPQPTENNKGDASGVQGPGSNVNFGVQHNVGGTGGNSFNGGNAGPGGPGNGNNNITYG